MSNTSLIHYEDLRLLEQLLIKNEYDQVLEKFGVDCLFELAHWYLFIRYSDGLTGIIACLHLYYFPKSSTSAS